MRASAASSTEREIGPIWSSEDAKAIADLARENNVPVMSCSAIRYAAGIAELHDEAPVVSCEAFGPAAILEDYPGLFWYGVHSAEVLFSLMGRGCASVQVTVGEQMDLIAGTWADGRIGTVRGFRAPDLKSFGATVITDKEVRHGLVRKDPPYYALMLREIMAFFRTGVAPIELEETVEIMAFLHAANQGRDDSGTAVQLAT